MDKKDAIETAQQYVYEVGAKYPLTRALVFGSFAKGTSHEDSDIDVAVVIKESDNIFDTQVDLMHMRRNDNLRIEPHAFREDDFDTDNPLVHEILQTGVALKIMA
ncbi:MAG: nucleotidyltransferase domain-containing protein [Prevotellaceae bacterium]|nr:nucleotidyltransferase domain-containing protein [Prevotellaceae bacterium]